MPKNVYTLADLKNWTAASADLDPPARLAVFGDPVAHSLSPQLHNPALAAAGLGIQYIRIHVTSGEVPEALETIRRLGFLGTNVTVPHKFTVLEQMDEVDPLAVKLGAVNTVVFDGEKKRGFNSDGPGFVRAIQEEFDVRVSDLRILVLGAGGGAGRAVAVQCAVEQCRSLTLVNRTQDKADHLARELQADLLPELLTVCPWNDDALGDSLENVDLVVNATSIGMEASDPDLLPSGLIRPDHLVFDMIYSPPRTRLLAAAAAVGARTANGLSMLVHQGAISFEHWFHRPAPVETMRRGVLAAIGGA